MPPRRRASANTTRRGPRSLRDPERSVARPEGRGAVVRPGDQGRPLEGPRGRLNTKSGWLKVHREPELEDAFLRDGGNAAPRTSLPRHRAQMTPPRCLQVALSSSPQPTWLRRLQAPEEALPPARRRRSPELGARPRRRGGPASPPGPRARRAGGAAAAPPRFGTATSSPDPRPLRAVNSDVQFRRWPSLGDSRLPPMLRVKKKMERVKEPSLLEA